MRDELKALCAAMASRIDSRRRCGSAAKRYTVAQACLNEALRELDAADLVFDAYVAKMEARAAETGRVFDRDALAIVYRKTPAAPRPKVEPKPKKATAAKKAAPKPKAKAKKKAKK